MTPSEEINRACFYTIMATRRLLNSEVFSISFSGTNPTMALNGEMTEWRIQITNDFFMIRASFMGAEGQTIVAKGKLENLEISIKKFLTNYALISKES